MNEKFSDERISAYLDDELAADERAAVERELADNADLRQAVEELRALRTGLQSLPRYRLETNIAERVLELAEREILTGGNRQRRDVAHAAATAHGDATASRATESHVTESQAEGRPQPSRRSDAPSARREGGFSWRNLVWSATAAGVAAMLMHFYHTTNRAQPLASAPPDRQVASADESRTDRRASRNEAGPSAGDEMATSTSIQAAPASPPRDQQAITRRSAPALDAATDRAVADAIADDAGIAADSVAAAEGKADDLPQPPSPLAENAASAARGSGGSAEERKSVEESALGGVGAASLAEDRGGFGGGRRGQPRQQTAKDDASSSSLPVSFVMLRASPEALRDGVFVGLLESNHVAVVDDRSGGGDLAMRTTGGERGGGSAAGDAAAGGELRQSAAAGRGGKEFSAEPELFAVDMTPEQLERVLAAVNRSSDDFAVVREFPVGAEDLLFAESRRAMSRDEDEFAADGALKEKNSLKKSEVHGEKTTDAKPGDVADVTPAATPQGDADNAPVDLPPEQDSEPAADPARSAPDRRNGRNGAGDRAATTLPADAMPADAMKDEARPKPNALLPRSLEQGDAAPGKTRAQDRPGAASRSARPPADKSFRGGLGDKGADNDRSDGNRENGNRQEQGDKQGKKPEQAMPPVAEAPHEAAKAEAAIAEPAAPAPTAPEPAASEPAAPVVAADKPKSAANAAVESPPLRAAGGRLESPPEAIARRVRPRSANDLEALGGESRRGHAQVERTRVDPANAPRAEAASGAHADALAEKAETEASLAQGNATRIRVFFLLQPSASAPSNALAAPAADAPAADAPATATPAEASPADAVPPASPE